MRTDEYTEKTMKTHTIMQEWTREQVQAAINKALENEPEGPNKEYWTTLCTIKDIKVTYGLKKFKPTPVTVTLVRECCGRQFSHTLTSTREAKGLTDWGCFDPECRLKVLIMPFGKFAGSTIPLVYEKEPSYLAWFHETVCGWENIKEAIRGLDGIETHLEEYRLRQQPKPRPTREQVEWLLGKFSSETIDSLCEELFGGGA
jgi:hypothetical protein